MKKKIVSVFIIIHILFSFCIASVQADNDNLNIKIDVDNDNGTIFVTGFMNEYGNIGIIVTDEDNTVYAMSETSINTDGQYSAKLNLPLDMKAGQYKVIVGGINSSKDKRSADFLYTAKKNDFLWIEAEDADVISGYKVVQSHNSSNGKYIVFDSDTKKENTAEYNFSVTGNGEYDIWVLATPGNVTYVSNYQWKLDNNGYAINENETYQKEYITSDLRQVGVYWSKISTEFIESGSHTLSFCCPNMRENNDFYYHMMDSILIVPKGWNWMPNDIQKPFSKTDIKAKINNVKLSSEQFSSEKPLNLIISASVEEETDQDMPLFAAVYWKDELVCSNYIMPKIPVSSWTAGKSYINSVTVTPPSYIPDGEYTVLCGFGYSNYRVDNSVYQAETVKKGEINTPNPKTIAFSKISAECKNEEIRVSAFSDCETTAKIYVTMWNGEELWGVSDTETVISKGINDFTFSVPDGIKKGEYTVKLGAYGYNSNSDTDTIMILTEGSKNYKPLSNGSYYAKKSGYEHFWYINQQNTLIWDGEPYIPMGGMECPTILSFYDENDTNANEENWLKDKNVLDMLVEQGVKDIYLNPVQQGADIPKFLWQFVMDEMEKRGFRYGMQYGASSDVKNIDLYYMRSNSEHNPISVTGITTSGVVTAEIDAKDYLAYGTPIAKAAKYTVVNEDNVPIICSDAQMEIIDGKLLFKAFVPHKGKGEYKVYFTPRFEQKVLTLVNYWDYGNEIIKDAEEFADKMEFGDGFREIIDPLANESGFYNQLECIRPVSDKFNADYAIWLENKYKNLSELNMAWGSEMIDNFAEASVLIPVYTSPKEQEYSVWAINPKTNKIYETDGRNGTMWLDFLEYRDQSFAKFNNETADALKKGLDVPIVLKNVWGHKAYFKNENKYGGIDGLGVEAYGNYNEIQDTSTSTFGMANTFSKTSWFIATETSGTEIVSDKDDYTSGMYGSEEYMHGHFDALYEMGAKGVFDFLFSGRHSDSLNQIYGYISHPKHFEWLRNYREKMNCDFLKDYVPEYDKICVIPHNSNWYTNPNRLTAVLYNDSFKTFRNSVKRNNHMFMVSDDAFVNADIVVANFENGPYSTTVGKEFGKRTEKISQGEKLVYVGVRKDLGTVAQIDKYFTNEFSSDNKGNRVQILNPPEEATVLAETADHKPWAMRYGNLWILTREKWCENYNTDILDEFGVCEASAQMSINTTITSDEQSELLKSGIWNCTVKAQNIVESHELKVYTAFYDQYNMLNRVMVEDVTFSPENDELEFSFDVNDMDETVKIMCWNDDMEPICGTLAKSRH